MEKKLFYKKETIGFIIGIMGAVLLLFMSWRQNMAMVVWLMPAMLIFSFRSQIKWYTTLPAAALCVAMKIMAMHGGWDIDFVMELAFGILVSMPLLTALYFDRYFSARAKPFLATLVFPAVYTAMDFLLSFSPVGMTFSIPYTQSRQLLLVQGSALFGSWFFGFVAAWFGPLINTVLQQASQGRKIWRILTAYVLVMAVLLGYGSAKQVFASPDSSNVRVGSITVEHPIDFWSITDAGTPREGSNANKAIMSEIGDELFRLSQKAADYGAKIIFWSEGNYVMYEDQYDAFIDKAGSFARENKVYLLSAILVLRYDSSKNDNKTVMINPEGRVEFEYEKTNSWYPTDSDGVIRKVDTPYGRIGSAICFDMDFPRFIRQAADVDIMLVPAYDTRKISPFHTEAALLRGVEYGFSVIRQCNAGTSIAADYNGNILASQDFFTTKVRCMISDVPTEGLTTLYEVTGEWFAWICVIALVCLITLGLLLLCSRLPLLRHIKLESKDKS